MQGYKDWIVRFLQDKKLPIKLAVIGAILTLPSVWIGFYLDDIVGYYLLTHQPGAEELLEAYGSPYGISNGNPESNHWQIEKGFAPWWTYEKLLISLFRPLSELIHNIDFYCYQVTDRFLHFDDMLQSHYLLHVHSILWFAALIFVTTLLYKKISGITTVSGLAAFLFAVDHTHGFTVGYIANRNALIAAFFGVLAIYYHHIWRVERGLKAALLSPIFFLCALLSAESAIAVIGYMVAYALFMDQNPLSRRFASLLPTFGVLIGWQASYILMGYGASGSGLYIDPVHEPLEFSLAVIERLPILVVGQFGLPPAGAYMFVSKPLAFIFRVGAVLFTLYLIVVSFPLWMKDPVARFWSFGMGCALIPICTTHPNNRLLIFAGLGAMPLLSQVWHGIVENAPWLYKSKTWLAFAKFLIAPIMGLHLLISPLLLPLTACSPRLSIPVNRAIARISQDVQLKNKDLVIVSSPDYFLVKLIPMINSLYNKEQPRRLRALSFGPIELLVTRQDSRTLSIDYRGGILQTPLMELYRDADIPMRKNQVIELEGLRIQVTGLTPDGRANQARFTFDAPLHADNFQWMVWDKTHYVPFTPPQIGSSVRIEPARFRFGL